MVDAEHNRRAIATIGDVALQTGLSKDTLRVWERRYGFPAPTRNANEERVYSSEQIERLQIIRRLLDGGLRPGKIVGLPLDELKMIATCNRTDILECDASPAPQQLLALIKAHRVDSIRQRLAQLLMQLGLRQFILEVVAPLNELVGNAWLTGYIEVFEEHLYTQQIQSVLHHSLGTIPPSRLSPRVLLTTLPGEEHQLGILMAHAFFAMEGAECVSLGTETPPAEVLRAAAVLGADIVGLSCSAAASVRQTHSQVSLLRSNLNRDVELWVGGSLAFADRHEVPGVRYVSSLRDISTLLSHRRALRPVIQNM